jgi:hypothetical protein
VLGRGARAGTESGISSGYLLLEKTLAVPLAAVLYQRRGPKQKFREALFDSRALSHPGAGLIEKLGQAYAALLHLLRRHEIKPLAGAGKVEINDNLVWTLVRETLDQLFDRAAKNPWRKLPAAAPNQFVCEPCDPEAPPAPHVCPAGQLNRMRYKSVAQRKAEGTYCVWPRPPAEPPAKLS